MLRHRRSLAAAVLSAAAVAGAAVAPATSASTPSPGHRCKLPGYSAVKFIYAVNGTNPSATVKVKNAAVYCGGPDDGHWDPIGAVHTMSLSANPVVKLIPANAKNLTAAPATLADLAQLAKLKSKDTKFGWYGDAYGVQIKGGKITAITELFHP